MALGRRDELRVHVLAANTGMGRQANRIRCVVSVTHRFIVCRLNDRNRLCWLRKFLLLFLNIPLFLTLKLSSCRVVCRLLVKV